ncbi:LysM peptidoglycan-binding domain-containing protein [Plantibacter sp. YIM 135347]|uniref:LysM peptidoglycan-binding domain-containing protein n=1 Tax=Plantibacter sp. YIM 135347 TaxID=3423919 RepID=UPI003D3261AC
MTAALIGFPSMPTQAMPTQAMSARAVPGSASTPSRTAPSHSRLRLTRRGRVVFTVLAALPLVVAVAVLSVGAGSAAASGPGVAGQSVQFTYVTVDPGESLWELAESIAPSADPRDVIAEIMNLNQLSTARVEPGQRLAIPQQYAS